MVGKPPSSPCHPVRFRLPNVNDHHGNFLECIRSRKTPLAPVEEAHRSATICHIGNIAMKPGRRLRWERHHLHRSVQRGRTSFMYAGRKCRINTYGDSFSRCHQVSDGETWQKYLAGHLGEPIRNFGMGGYGVYQAYRRMLREERTDHAAEYLILYIWDDDHIRSPRGNHFFAYSIADKSIPLDTYRSLGEPIPGGAHFKRLAALAREVRIVLVAGMLEADGEARYNTAVLVSAEGALLGKYRKQHLEHELVRNRRGTSSPMSETPYGRMGLLARHSPADAGERCDDDEVASEEVRCLSWMPLFRSDDR